MHHIIAEHTERRESRVDIGKLGSATGIGRLVHAVPEAEMRATGRAILDVVVVGIGHPVGGRRDIIVLQTGARLDEHGHVAVEAVVFLDAVLQEEGAAHDVVDEVLLDLHPVGAVDVGGAVEGLVDGALLDVGRVHVAVQVEVDGVATQAESLCITNT